jgi:hypothetical protein
LETRLDALAPSSVVVETDANLDIRMLLSSRGQAAGFEVMFVEPDGEAF